MGSLYVVGESRYRTFTLLCKDEAQKGKVTLEFAQDFLNNAWPMARATGDSNLSDKSRDGKQDDIAGLIIVLETDNALKSYPPQLYKRLPLAAGETVHHWSPHRVMVTQDTTQTQEVGE